MTPSSGAGLPDAGVASVVEDGDHFDPVPTPAVEHAVRKSLRRRSANPVIHLAVEIRVSAHRRQGVTHPCDKVHSQAGGALLVLLRRLVDVRFGLGGDYHRHAHWLNLASTRASTSSHELTVV